MINAKGIDASKWQGKINWKAVASNGVEFAALRVTVGDYYTDPTFEANWKGAREAGILVTAYHAVAPNCKPATQMQRFNQATAGKTPDLPWVLDVELSRGYTPQAVTKCVKECAALTPPVRGRKPLIYTNQGFGNPYLLENFGLELWVANYTTAAQPAMPKMWSKWLFWQYSNVGKVDGITENVVDLDRFDGTMEELRAWAGLPEEKDPLVVWAEAVDAWARGIGYEGPGPE